MRLDPLAGGTGGGGKDNAGPNTARHRVGAVPVDANTNTVTNAAQPRLRGHDVRGAPVARRLLAASVGYAGSASDGLKMLDAAHR